MRFLLASFFILALPFSVSAATIVTTNAKITKPFHYEYEYGGKDIGAYLSIWTKNNWRTALVWLRPKGEGSSSFSRFIVDCGYQCIDPGASAVMTGWGITDPNCPCGSLTMDTNRPFKFSLRRSGNTQVDAWAVLSGAEGPGGLYVNMRFFGGELRHSAFVTLDDRSQKRYNFAFGDAPARRGFQQDPTLSGLADGDPVPTAVSAPVPLPASGALLASLIAVVLGLGLYRPASRTRGASAGRSNAGKLYATQ